MGSAIDDMLKRLDEKKTHLFQQGREDALEGRPPALPDVPYVEGYKNHLKPDLSPSTLAKRIVEAAYDRASEMDYSLEEALGDVMGKMLPEVDAALKELGDELPKDGMFKINFLYQVKEWFT